MVPFRRLMRRLLLWILPVSAALLSAVIFGAGFLAFIRGDTGTPVGAPPRAVVTAAPQNEVVPLVLGDSIGRGAGDTTSLGIGGRLVEELQRRHIAVKPVANLAVNGARTRELLTELDHRNVRMVIAQSNVIIISIGGNDLWSEKNWRAGLPRDPEAAMQDVLGRVVAIVKIVRDVNPTARIFVIGLYNPYAKERFGPVLSLFVKRWNTLLTERFATDPRIDVVETFDIFAYRDRLSIDHFHPSDEGYALIARRIADAI